MGNTLPYDEYDPLSIEEHGRQLEGNSLSELYPEVKIGLVRGKGGLGRLVEAYHFGLPLSNESRPDFEKAGVELKTTPLKETSKGLVAKERLVLNMIDYHKEVNFTFDKSSFFKKNQRLLLVFYVHKKGRNETEQVFELVRLWEFPEADLRIIREDWQKILSKIIAGKAHELSEGDTLYLGACTKGSDGDSRTTQPASEITAKPRAYSLKQKYVNHILMESRPEWKRISKDVDSIVSKLPGTSKKMTFEESLVSRFTPYYGWTESQLMKEFDIEVSPKAKNRYELIAKRIMGVTKKRIEEFEKADVLMKTVRVNRNGGVRESMSFPQIRYIDIVNEEWETSEWHAQLTRRFFLVIFRDTENGYSLQKASFWAIPVKDLEVLRRVWVDTRDKITAGVFDDFIKASDGMIGHVRPKAKDSGDLMNAPDGSMQKKKCFWLNSLYIHNILEII
jgi:DNA mismatch repair protein MutH